MVEGGGKVDMRRMRRGANVPLLLLFHLSGLMAVIHAEIRLLFNLFVLLSLSLLAYASFKAIETPSTDDDKQWLTYWTVIGFVQMIEYFSDILLFWFPFYYLFKTLLVLYLALPQFRVSVVVGSHHS